MTSCKFEASNMIDLTAGMRLEAVMWLPGQTGGVPHILQEKVLCYLWLLELSVSSVS